MKKEKICFFKITLFLILFLIVSTLPLSAENAEVQLFFNLDIGADLFNQAMPQFNILERDYTSIQTTKNIEIVKKQINEKFDDPMIAYETVARFVRAESYSFTDIKRALKSLETLDAQLNKAKLSNKSKNIDNAFSLYQLLINVSKIILTNDFSESNKKYITNEITRLLEHSDTSWNLILKLLIESAIPNTGDHKITAQRILNIKSGNPQNHFIQANAFLLAGSLCKCEKTRMLAPRSFEISLILTANDERLLERIVNILIAILEDNEAKSIQTPLWLTEYSYKKLIQQDPENPVSRNNLGYFYATYNIKLDQAYKHCVKAVEIDPENPYFLDSLGWVCFRMGKLDESLKHLTKARKINSEIAEIRAHLANVYYSLEKFDKTVNELKALLKIEPDNIIARNNLGYILTDKNMDLNLAYKHLTYALNKAPDDPSYNDSLGWLYYKADKLNLARKYIEKALRIKPDMPEVLFHLSKLQLKEKKMDKALKTSLQVLKLSPDLDGLVNYIGFVTAIKALKQEIESISSLKTQSAQSIAQKIYFDSFTAELYFKNKFYTQALNIYEKLLTSTPNKQNFINRIKEIKKIRPLPLNVIKIKKESPVQFPDYLKMIPNASIQASVIKKDLINRIFNFSINNINYLKIFNPGLLKEMIPEKIIQSIFRYEDGDKAVFLLVAEYNKTENLKENLKGISNIVNLFSKKKRVKETTFISKNSTLKHNLWEISISNYLFYINIADNKLIVSSSKEINLTFINKKKFDFTSITTKENFDKLWQDSNCKNFHAIFYSNKKFYEALFSKIPALKNIKKFNDLLKISDAIEKIHFTDANTLDEYYSLKCQSPDAANQLGNFINELMAMSKTLYESDKIAIVSEIKTEDSFLNAHIKVKGFLGMKDFINKHILKNKNLLINFIKSVSPVK